MAHKNPKKYYRFHPILVLSSYYKANSERLFHLIPSWAEIGDEGVTAGGDSLFYKPFKP